MLVTNFYTKQHFSVLSKFLCLQAFMNMPCSFDRFLIVLFGVFEGQILLYRNCLQLTIIKVAYFVFASRVRRNVGKAYFINLEDVETFLNIS